MTAHPRRRTRKLDLIRLPHGQNSEGPKLLAIRETGEGLLTTSLIDTPGSVPLGYRDLSAQFLAEYDPDIVVTNLLSKTFDCTDVARKLVEAGFLGEFRVLCPALPRPELVVRELQSTYPELDIDIWVLPGL